VPSVDKLARRVQSLVGEVADQAAEESKVIKRKRVFSPSTLAATFILAFLAKPKPSDRDLAAMAAMLGAPVTEQAFEYRYSPALVEFLKRLFTLIIQKPLASEGEVAPLLQRFTDVQILDSTTISLPEEEAATFPGCGAVNGLGKAAVKIQVRMSLKTGALEAVRLEPGRDCDLKTPLQQDLPLAGTLLIKDLGYFDTAVFQRLSQHGAYWLSPLVVGTNVYRTDGEQVSLLPWLAEQGGVTDCRVLLGAAHHVPCRLIAWRLPEEVGNRRRQKVWQQCRRKGRTPSQERLDRCDWATLVTNLPVEEFSINEVRVLYRSRWQIELLFKRWKSQGRVDELQGQSSTRKLAGLWAGLLSAVVQQWMQTGVWGRPDISLTKAWNAISHFAQALALSLNDIDSLKNTLERLYDLVEKTIRRSKRKKATTFELLYDPTRLPYALT
jgi:hypothetical protein